MLEEHILLDKPMDVFSFDNIFLETGIAQGLIFKSKRSGKTFILTMHVDPVY